MRILLVAATAAVLIGGAIATIKVPNIRGQERVLAQYQADPNKMRINMRAAILKCVPDITESRIGMQFTNTVIVPLYVKILHMRKDGADRATISTQMQKWIINEHPKLLTGLPDKDFLELLSFLKKMGEDDVENCILDAASEPAKLNESVRSWNIRV